MIAKQNQMKSKMETADRWTHVQVKVSPGRLLELLRLLDQRLEVLATLGSLAPRSTAVLAKIRFPMAILGQTSLQ